MKEIKLSSGALVLVDDEDYDLVSKHKWYETKAIRKGKYYTSYAIGKDGTTTKRKTIAMHRLIMGFPDGLFIDHINHNGLDNRKENLRIVTSGQNQRNLRPGSIPRILNLKGIKPTKKLSDNDIQIIINSKGVLQRELAKRFNVTQQTISMIKKKHESKPTIQS